MKNWNELTPEVQQMVKRGCNMTIQAIAEDLLNMQETGNDGHLSHADLSEYIVCYSSMYARINGEAKDWLKEACKGDDKFKNLDAAVTEWQPKGYYL